MRLSDICTLHTGDSARGRLDRGDLLTIQLRDVSPNTRVNSERLTRVCLGELPKQVFRKRR